MEPIGWLVGAAVVLAGSTLDAGESGDEGALDATVALVASTPDAGESGDGGALDVASDTWLEATVELASGSVVSTGLLVEFPGGLPQEPSASAVRLARVAQAREIVSRRGDMLPHAAF